MRRLPMTWVGQRIWGVAGAALNCGRAWTCALERPGAALDKRSSGSRIRERITPLSKLTADPERITPLSKLTGDPERITPLSKLTGDPERWPKRLERVRTGWDVHFRELALTRIPVKITTPSLHFKLLNIFPNTAGWGKPLERQFLHGKRHKLFWFRLTPLGKMFHPARSRREIRL